MHDGDEPWDEGSLTGNHSLVVEGGEILFDTEERLKKFSSTAYKFSEMGNGDPKAIEFMGNGMPYMGTAFTRAVILIFPRKNRAKVGKQLMGATNNPFMSSEFDWEGEM